MTEAQSADGAIERAGAQPTDRGPPVIRTIAMPADTNPAGDIFGGWLMAQMDLAAGNVAARRARGRCATIAVDAITFHHPVFVGDEVSLYAWLVKVGRSSLRIQVEVWRRERASEATMKVTEATFTFVAIGDDRRPRPVPVEAAAG
ncbi:acyl-CoA thioesterase YciA [Methylobacterium phyllostachyos]|uniref:Acyl-CoA thioesterase YciA n=1 Tax=Methylobacterium phyllostachyos TaxID=582672 RepID=A0A1H0FXS5_9HYPH|nr:acyl-CoA thioesterase [Methylobacterium phyllostachyos]SDN99410.1 acyl-CoA thioesterase YciA [Methylobacterium phyllostachyos]